MKIIVNITAVVTLAILFLHLIFFWINMSIDSYYYWAIGSFLKTGIYRYDIAFMPTFTKPPTVSPPAYGLVLMALEYFPRPATLLHALQLILLGGTGYFTYKTLRYFLTQTSSAVIACLLILIPGNLVYASLMLTEIGAEFLVAIYAWSLVRYLKTADNMSIGLATGIGFASTVWKYGFILFGVYAGLLFLHSKRKQIIHFAVAASGFLVVVSWIIINHDITGVWGLSNYGGIRLWNQIVAEGGMLPTEDTASMKDLRSVTSKSTLLHQPYYVVMYDILPHVGNNLSAVDRIMGAVAWDAVRQHPVQYLTTAVKLFWQLHRPGTPFWENTFQFSSKKYTQYCGKLGLYQLCKPLIKTPHSLYFWDTFLKLSITYYQTIFPTVATVFFLPSLFILAILGTRIERSVVLLYILGIIPIIFYEHLDIRFIVPYYPLMVLVLAFAFRRLLKASLFLIKIKHKLG